MNRISPLSSSILDLIRFLSSQAVLLCHMVVFFGYDFQYLLSMGSHCLLMFFVLSGFLISYSIQIKLASDPNYGFRHYFNDRFFRIFPPYIATLIFVFIVDLIGFKITGHPYSLTIYIGNFIINALQLQEFPVAIYLNHKYMIEFFRFHFMGTNLSLWTISIEWWLYMFYGFFVFYFIRSKKIKWFHWIILLALLITPVFYVFMSVRMERGLTLYWFLGAVLTAIGFSQVKGNKLLLIAGVGILFVGMFGFSKFGSHAAMMVFFLGMFLMLKFDDGSIKIGSKIIQKFIERAAGFSYSLYLIHYTLLYFIVTVFKPEKDIYQFAIVFLIVNIIAFVFAEIFEKNSKKLKLIYENYRSGKNRLQKKV